MNPQEWRTIRSKAFEIAQDDFYHYLSIGGDVGKVNGLRNYDGPSEFDKEVLPHKWRQVEAISQPVVEPLNVVYLNKDSAF